jgi:cysteinyl-tRNA synthetase
MSDTKTTDQIEQLVAERIAAKKAGDAIEAFRIGQELEAMGVELQDTAQGTVWRAAAMAPQQPQSPKE